MVLQIKYDKNSKISSLFNLIASFKMQFQVNNKVSK